MTRIEYGIDGEIKYKDSGFIFRTKAYDGRKTLLKLAEPRKFTPWRKDTMCQTMPECGFPSAPMECRDDYLCDKDNTYRAYR